MSTWIAFLRAINLGARRTFPKDDVLAAVVAAGGRDAVSHLGTGNVRLTLEAASRREVETALEAAFLADRGFEVPTVALSVEELRDLVADADRIGAGHAGVHTVSLLKADPDPEAVHRLEAPGRAGETARVVGRAVHLLLPVDVHTARLGNAVVERHLGVATNRNVRVLRTVRERWCG
ncbi:DUF1697 domain-containing protein [Nocardioides kribbensis]|uniref:DUF1697 domain-containing protein n=1 Tax=Nocardioides kribbensis TaxID=305517 RepID=UPI001879C6EE|nr:DUF1697 domain-containing protein [Nocardioides kribbensis]